MNVQYRLPSIVLNMSFSIGLACLLIGPAQASSQTSSELLIAAALPLSVPVSAAANGEVSQPLPSLADAQTCCSLCSLADNLRKFGWLGTNTALDAIGCR